ncbi:sorbosone dehydrogenase family protein [Ancylobacter sonchi]|uniref:PQQ-dependent sugar dehydrogenase n=1 Tax=Ancylobacter sonchi TaxID=1937790 RepID=UPI001BD50EDB|nr:sorbosone dehydrogenase family protein [Ancylobacter sonchi]MBS7534743.1 sorbosone dehydrogenase family protein [Ancylobacter sonchi]
MSVSHVLLAALAFSVAFPVSGPHARQAPAPRSILETEPHDWIADVVSDQLSYPWDINRSGDMLILTEAGGTIVMIAGGKLTRYWLETSDPVVHDGGGGLLGMALPDDFPHSGLAYLYHSYRSGSGLTNKVIEARFDGRSWRETRVLIAGIPGHRLYNGGRIAIGPDGHLYVTTGWTENPARPQDLGSLAGKVLRMTRNGEVPADNPFPGSFVYSYGHRNPQGLAWSRRGELYVSEHGQSARDEINLIRPGGNYGWPVISGTERREGMEPPLLSSGGDTWAPSGIAFAGDELLVTALGARGLYVFDERAGRLKPVFSSGERFRDVLPVDGRLYVITTNRSPRADGPSNGDRLIRLSPRQ